MQFCELTPPRLSLKRDEYSPIRANAASLAPSASCAYDEKEFLCAKFKLGTEAFCAQITSRYLSMVKVKLQFSALSANRVRDPLS